MKSGRNPSGPSPQTRARGLTVSRLLEAYQAHRRDILDRLDDFARVRQAGDEALFKELCFCILAANSSAAMGLKTLDAIGDLVWEGDLASMQARLSGGGFRYWRVRPAYIVHTREALRRSCGLKLGEWLESLKGHEARRDRLAADPDIKGIGYKEASHFLRNVGFRGYAILDKHILACLKELEVIGRGLRPAPARRYRLIERRMRRFAEDVGIGMDELDLVLWRWKTGTILK